MDDRRELDRVCTIPCRPWCRNGGLRGRRIVSHETGRDQAVGGYGEASNLAHQSRDVERLAQSPAHANVRERTALRVELEEVRGQARRLAVSRGKIRLAPEGLHVRRKQIRCEAEP